MSAPSFVPYSVTHRAGCLALFDDNCPDDFAPNERGDYLAFLDACPPGYRVCAEDGTVVAAFGLVDAGRPGHRRLNWILVSRRMQGRGVGRHMMDEARRLANEAGLRVVDIAASHRSAPFFAKYGARAVRRTDDGWGPGMHRIDMEWRISPSVLSAAGGTVVVPQLVLVDRTDGGHLVVNPVRDVWERSELTRDELAEWSCLAAAAGRAMIDVLPQLRGGCVNYWDAGNWALHAAAEPAGPKDPREHRRVHLHLFGRSRAAQDPAWQWGEAPQFPLYADRLAWSARFEPLNADECDRVAARAAELLETRYAR